MNDLSNNTPSTSDLEAFKPWLISHLRMGNVTVDFEKVNGDFRSMECTLQESAIPETQLPKPLAEGATPRKVSEESLRVFDVNKQEWRAFRWDKVKSVSFHLGDEVKNIEEPAVV